MLYHKGFFYVTILSVFLGLSGCGSTSGSDTAGITGAVAPSNHYVIVSFDEPPADASANPADYSITGPNDAPLAIVDGAISEDGETVILTTESQQNVEYHLNHKGDQQAGSQISDFLIKSAMAAVNSTTSFTGSLQPEPVLLTAISLNSTSVLLTFNEKMSTVAETIAYYRIVAADDSAPVRDVGDVTITAASLGDDTTTVILTTTPQDNIEFNIKVTNITSDPNGMRIDPTHNTSTFFGIATVDNDAPRLSDVDTTGPTTMILTFSEPLGDNADDPANFSIYFCSVDQDPCPLSNQVELVVTDASLNQHNTQVTLTTQPQEVGVEYIVVVNNVEDQNGNSIDTASNTSSTTYNGDTNVNLALDPPRVIGAASTSNTTVVVSFSKAMSASAENAQNYVVVQENVNAEAGSLGVVSARYLSSDRSAVELTTRSQNELTYRVTVVNVQDTFGQELDSEYTNGGLIFANSVLFPGTPPNIATFIDTDGDGITDNEEQRGWTTTIVLLGGETITREVTSDIEFADSDGDGLTDKEELNLRTDPRDVDTDDDQLGDAYEFNGIFSNPLDQDTDKDGLSDGLEVSFFETSPLLVDTDGDQIDDDEEVILANRNPRLSDLPQPSIEIGNVDLQLDVRFQATSELETRELDTKTVSSTLTQSQSKSHSNTDEINNEFTAKVTTEHEWSSGVDGGYTGKIGAEVGGTHQWNSSYTTESSNQSQKEYAKSLETEKEKTEGETISREVVGATIKVAVSVRSIGDVAFTMSNLQITALMPDKRNPGRFLPIATLVPEIPAGSTIDSSYNLGPLVNERGPFVFTNSEVFPSLVERLMSDPTGLVFRISNYDITDELERNFAFTSQNIADRTAPLVIDFGGADVDKDGIGDNTERYRVATSFGRATSLVIEQIAMSAETTEQDARNRYGLDSVDGESPLVFDLNGKALGVEFHDVMQSVLGLKHYDEDNNSTESLTAAEKAKSYSTQIINGVETVQRIRGVKNKGTIDEATLETWEILNSEGLLPRGQLALEDQVLLPNKGLRFAYIQDLDGDGMPARLEYLNGCSDKPVVGIDTDNDGLDDRLEVYGTPKIDSIPLDDSKLWKVNVKGFGDYEAFSRCNMVDSDQDGLFDLEEYDGRIYIKTEDGKTIVRDTDGKPEVDARFKSFDRTDPKEWDTDGDGISDLDEIKGYFIQLRFALLPPDENASYWCVDVEDNPDFPGRDTVLCTSDPLDPDSDDDTLNDGAEVQLGSDPNRNDGADVLDLDGDGLVGREENDGWLVTWEKVSNTALNPGVQVNCMFDPVTQTHSGCVDNENEPPTSSTNRKDTDGDGLLDNEEFGSTHPRDVDTDGDTLTDFEELMGYRYEPGVPVPGELAELTNPLDADSDNDTLSDGEERIAYTVGPVIGTDGKQLPSVNLDTTPGQQTTDPNDENEDDDKLTDADERLRGTDARNSDTDNDGVVDGNEIVFGSDPLNGAETCIRVTYETFTSVKACEGINGGTDEGDFAGALKAQVINPSGTGPGVEVTTVNGGSGTLSLYNDDIAYLNASHYFLLEKGGNIRLYSGGLQECDGPCGDGSGDIYFGFEANVTYDEVLMDDKIDNPLVKGSEFPDDCQIKVGYRVSRLTDSDANDTDTFCRAN